MSKLLILRNNLGNSVGSWAVRGWAVRKSSLLRTALLPATPLPPSPLEGQETHLSSSAAEQQAESKPCLCWVTGRLQGAFMQVQYHTSSRSQLILVPHNSAVTETRFITASVVPLRLLNQQPQWFPRSSRSSKLSLLLQKGLLFAISSCLCL